MPNGNSGRNCQAADRSQESETLPPALAARAAGFRHWIFDLDDTLYDPESRVFAEVRARIALYLERRLGLAPEAARALRDRYHARYGATLGGLLSEHDVVPEEYLSVVHAVSLEAVSPSARRIRFLSALPGRRYLFTNSSVVHGARVLRRLGLARCFDEIFDVAAAGWAPKPRDRCYDMFLSRHGVDPGTAVFFEDSACNLAPAKARGIATVLVQGAGEYDEARNRGHRHAADHVTHDIDSCLAAFVQIAQNGSGPEAADKAHDPRPA